jgi:hypothetical protein
MSNDLNTAFAAVDALGARAVYLDCAGFAECSLDDDDACWAIFEAANAWAVATDQYVRSEYTARLYRVHVVAVVAGWHSPLV